MSNIKLNCCGCGKELGLGSRVSTDGVLWRCEDCARKQREEYDNKDKKIADPEAKLAEVEKELMDNEKCFTEKDVESLIKDREETIKFLKQQLAEKEKELHYKTSECEKWKADYENCSKLEKMMTKERQYCLDNWRASDQDKIEFTIEKLEEMKKSLFDVWAMGYGEICKYEIEDAFDEKIKQLKEKNDE